MESIFFEFNGQKSVDMGQYLIRMNSGGVDSPFFGGQSIREEKLKNRLLPYHFGTEKNPLEFTIEISPLEEEWTPERRAEIGQWLIHDTYKPFQTTDDMGKIYYAIATEAPNFELYSNRGFIPITFRTNSPYAWSTEQNDYFDLTSNIGTEIITMKNLSNINKNYFPKIQIKFATGGGPLKLKNLTNGGKTLEITHGFSGQIISIDNENEIIIPKMPGEMPPGQESFPEDDAMFEKFNEVWLELVYGDNRIEVTGKCEIWTKMQFPILQ